MKQLVGDKMWDTEKATEIADYWNGKGNGDYSAMTETLFRTKNGAWFLELEYGCQITLGIVSKGFEPYPGFLCPYFVIEHKLVAGERLHQIMPLCDDEVKEWMEARNVDAGIAEANFVFDEA